MAFGTAKAITEKPDLQREAGSSEDQIEPSENATKPSDPKWEEMRRAREAYEARQAQNDAAEPSNPSRPVQSTAENATASPQSLAGKYTVLSIRSFLSRNARGQEYCGK